MAVEASGLRFLDNQPIMFDLETDACAGILDTGYCQKFTRTDPVHIQIERLPCGDNAACTSNLPSYGADLVTDGGFATDLSAWPTTVGWTWVAGVAQAPAPPAANNLTQSMGLVANQLYRLRVNVTGLDPGDVLRVYVGRTAGWYSITSNGAIDINVRAGSENTLLTFEQETTNTGTASVDNVILEPHQYCYNGAGWTYDTVTNKYTHIAGTAVALQALVDFVNVGKTYKFKVVVTAATVGTFQIVCGAMGSDLLSGNGTFTRYLNAGSATGFNIVPSSDFDGTIEITEIYALTEPTDLYLVDMNNNDIADLTGFYSFTDNKIDILFTLAQLVADTGVNEGLVLNGCYKIRVSGLCNPINADLVTNGAFNGGNANTCPSWSNNNGGSQYDFTGSNAQFLYGALPGEVKFPVLRNVTNPLMIAGTYEIRFDIISNTDTTNIGITAALDTQGEAGSPYYSTVGTHVITLDFDPDLSVDSIWGIQRLNLIANFRKAGVDTTGNIVVDNVEVRRLQPLEGINYSNCIQFADEWPCTKWIEATNPCLAHGFDFRGTFKIGMRVKFLKWGAQNEIEENSYLHSDGTNERTYSRKDKKWQGKIDYVDEITHDAMVVALLSKTFTIDGEQYFLKGNQYKTSPNKSGRFSLSQARFELSKMTSATFANNCGDCDGVTVFPPCAEFCETAISLKSDAPALTAGWYMVDGQNLLESHDGAVFTGITKTCDGFVLCYPGNYSVGEDYSGPYRFNTVLGDWEPIIDIENPVLSLGQVTLSAIILAAAAGKIQTSINGGTTWLNATSWRSQAQLLSGISFAAPVSPFRFRLVMKFSTCEYYSQEILDFE